MFEVTESFRAFYKKVMFIQDKGGRKGKKQDAGMFLSDRTSDIYQFLTAPNTKSQLTASLKANNDIINYYKRQLNGLLKNPILILKHN